MKPRLDHIGLDVSDYETSKAFYEKALAPLGMRVLMEPAPEVGGFGDDFPFFWIARRNRGPDSGVHVAFTAEDRASVDAFHEAALAASGRDNGGPGYGRSTTPTTTGPSCSTRMATTSRLSVTPRPERHDR
jgi:catechol 2,3-dioxygenase-like lactoylglutathione lyase family enzyme